MQVSQNIGVWLLLAAWTNNINSYASPHTVFTATKQQQMSLSVAQAPTLWVLEPKCGGPTGFEPCTCIHNVTWRFKRCPVELPSIPAQTLQESPEPPSDTQNGQNGPPEEVQKNGGQNSGLSFTPN